jgi:hypothetical protein
VAVLIASLLSAGVAAFDEPGALGGIISIGVICLCLFACLALLWQLLLAFLYPLAQRSLVLEERGVVEAVRHGWQILSRHVGEMLLLVLLLFLIGIVFGVFIAIILVPLGLLLAVPTILELIEGGLPSARQLATIGVGAILLALIGQVLRGFFVTYQSAAFTIAYRRLTGSGVAAAPSGPPPVMPYQFEKPTEE